MRSCIMDEKQLNIVLENESELDRKIDFYLKRKIINKQVQDENEIKGHIEKSEHNINFIKSTLDDGFSDWAIVGCYYAAYHIALALILKKGYSSKNHDATLCVLIKEYYRKYLSIFDIVLLNKIYLDNEDILFYVKSKDNREKASYSTKIAFDNNEVEALRQKTLLFVRKAQKILNEI